jgi:hypothetical protein
MRKLSLPLLLALLALLATAVPTQANPLPSATLQLVAFDEEEPEAGEPEEPWEKEDEACEFDPEEPDFCEEIEEEAGDDGCLLEDARAKVVVNPGKRRLLLTVHYRALKPAGVSVATVLRGAKGAVRLGTGHARFHRAGVYHDSFRLTEKQTERAQAARKLDVDLRVLNSPRYCGLHLNEAVRRPKR